MKKLEKLAFTTTLILGISTGGCILNPVSFAFPDSMKPHKYKPGPHEQEPMACSAKDERNIRIVFYGEEPKDTRLAYATPKNQENIRSVYADLIIKERSTLLPQPPSN